MLANKACESEWRADDVSVDVLQVKLNAANVCIHLDTALFDTFANKDS